MIGECQKIRHLTDHIAKNQPITGYNSGIALANVTGIKVTDIKIDKMYDNIDC